MEQLKLGYGVLEKQKFRAPDTYLSSELCETAWNNYKKLYQKTNDAFQKSCIKL